MGLPGFFMFCGGARTVRGGTGTKPLASASAARTCVLRDAFVHPSHRAVASSVSRRWRGSDAVPPRDGLRRADRGASGLQPCGTSMGRFAAPRLHDGATRGCPSHVHGKPTLQLHLEPPSQHF